MEFIHQNILLIGVVVGSGIALLWPMLAGAGGVEVSPAQATQLINRDDAQIIDVREDGEFAGGHLPEAVHVPLSKLSERLADLEKFKDKPLIVYCASGMRSGRACRQLKKQGFASLHNLAGGVDAWVGAGYPIKKSGRNK
jgi:rhodanese-related sulfurtransferase